MNQNSNSHAHLDSSDTDDSIAATHFDRNKAIEPTPQRININKFEVEQSNDITIGERRVYNAPVHIYHRMRKQNLTEKISISQNRENIHSNSESMNQFNEPNESNEMNQSNVTVPSGLTIFLFAIMPTVVAILSITIVTIIIIIKVCEFFL